MNYIFKINKKKKKKRYFLHIFILIFKDIELLIIK